jgi:allophanate hydrolase
MGAGADEEVEWFQLVVAGAHMSGMSLNNELEALGAELVAPRRTAPVYRMFSVGPKPMLLRHPQDGVAFDVEVYRIPIQNVG